MAKAKKLTVFERGRIVELHKQGFSQRAIAAEVVVPPPWLDLSSVRAVIGRRPGCMLSDWWSGAGSNSVKRSRNS
ncbi:unnamed protein product [Pleuronectes platessa]|uniref:Transposase IS30-like HTH domain-containing protein n=1 Tax=Pleuronectes platessa TaxID=8262 RepID=A0A9N7TI61_PLEPL|nr:unnamed protein product [Pleuronectes platessa]